MKICETDNEHRGNLFLRQISGVNVPASPAQGIVTEGETRSMNKLHRFFGVDPSIPKPPSKRTLVVDPNTKILGSSKAKSLFSSEKSPNALMKLKNKNLYGFFGERPPDEMIVDQLEKFFPGINVSKDSATITISPNIKNIVEENLKQKRSSKRESSLMLRKRLSRVDFAEEKDHTTSAMGKRFARTVSSLNLEPTLSEEPDDLSSEVPEENVAAPDTHTSSIEPKPISFRWAPGRLIGQGAFGKVFHALNLDNGEFMAVKQMLSASDESQQKKSNDSLQREIEILRDLHHDNIVQYLGFENSEDSINVFLEYVSGGSLSSCLSKCGKFAEDITRSFTAQILCGLEYLHDRDIIHRDIKGANSI